MGLLKKLVASNGKIVGLIEEDVLTIVDTMMTNIGPVLYKVYDTPVGSTHSLQLSRGISLTSGIICEPITYALVDETPHTIPNNYMILYKKNYEMMPFLYISDHIFDETYEVLTPVPVETNMGGIMHSVSKFGNLCITSNIKYFGSAELKQFTGSESDTTPLVVGDTITTINPQGDLGYLYNNAAFTAFLNGTIALSPEVRVMEYPEYQYVLNNFPNSSLRDSNWNYKGLEGLYFMPGKPRFYDRDGSYVNNIAIFICKTKESSIVSDIYMYDNASTETLYLTHSHTGDFGYVKAIYKAYELHATIEDAPQIYTTTPSNEYKILKDGSYYNLIGNHIVWYNMSTPMDNIKIVKDGTLI